MNFDLPTLALWATILSPPITIVSVLIAAWALKYTVNHDSKVLRHSLRLDFSKRYQDLMTAMPDGLEFNRKFALLYFDLCAEEYRLHQEAPEMIGSYTWLLWQEGMEDTLENHPELAFHWKSNRNAYASTNDSETESFQTFFDDILVNQHA